MKISRGYFLVISGLRVDINEITHTNTHTQMCGRCVEKLKREKEKQPEK